MYFCAQMKRFLFSIWLVFILNLYNGIAQNAIIKGIVMSDSNRIAYAAISISDNNQTAVSDENGNFFFKNVKEGKHLITVHAIGYITYKQMVTVGNLKELTLNIQLVPKVTEINEVVITATLKESSRAESPVPIEVFQQSFFKKNPVPNFFEALSLVNGVQPQINCNVCNTGSIHINGMDGPYTMVLIDGMPIVSALSTVYGLMGIPSSIIQRVEIVKGPASTLYGSEAVGGLINIITKSPETAPKFTSDINITSLNEINADFSARFKVKKHQSILGANVFWFDKMHDINQDGFTDLSLQKRVSIFNKWNFYRKSGKEAALAVRYSSENRWGGQTNYRPEFLGTDSVYAEVIKTNRVEVIGKYQFAKSFKNLRLDYSYNAHLQESFYGIKQYNATQHVFFTQLLYNKQWKKHDVMFGLPFRYTYYDDNSVATATSDSVKPRNKPMRQVLPGIFVQDEFKINSKTTALLGMRYDYHSIQGSVYSPRLSIKHAINKYNTIRFSAGNGFRVVNLFTEDHAALTGARDVIIKETLNPEKSWNINLNSNSYVFHRLGYSIIDISAFYTHFSNKIVADLLTNAQQIIYQNLNGFAISKGISLSIENNLENGIKAMAGFTLMDVYQRPAVNAAKIPQLYAPQFSATYSVSYTIPKTKILLDFTGRYTGTMNLPVLPNDFRPAKSPGFTILNLQVSNNFTEHLQAYISVKNILNFIPQNPLMRPFDPFDKQVNINNPNNYTFDAAYNYAPMQGIKLLIGFRWMLD